MRVKVTVDFELPPGVDEYYTNKVVQAVGDILEPFVIGRPEWNINYAPE